MTYAPKIVQSGMPGQKAIWSSACYDIRKIITVAIGKYLARDCEQWRVAGPAIEGVGWGVSLAR